MRRLGFLRVRPRFPLRLFRALAGPRGRFAPDAADVAALGGDRFRAAGPDPRFLFRAPLPLAPLALACRSARPGGLAPRVFLDWGGGFSAQDSFVATPDVAVLLRLDPSGCPDLRALRFDPFEGDGEFTFRSAAGEAADPLTREAEGVAQRFALRDFAPARPGRPFGLKRSPRTTQEHFERVCALAERELAGRFADPGPTPTISFVTPTYNTPPGYLDDLLASFRAQPPGCAELVLSDDGSTAKPTLRWFDAQAGAPGVTVRRGEVNRGIAGALNAGVAVARGRWIGFVDHDDALAPHAVAVLLLALEAEPQVRFLYTDEVIADGRLCALDFFDKPAFDDVLLSGVNFVNHLSLYRRDLLDEVGGLREGFDGSQDYDLLLRALKRLTRDEIRHLPYPAYVWRRDGRSYSVTHLTRATANARRALAEAYALDPGDIEPAVLPDLHRLRFDRVARARLSIVVVSRDAADLARLLDALPPEAELIVVADDPTSLALGARRDVALVRASGPAAARFNLGAAQARGDALVRLDGDLTPTTSDWLAEMAGCLTYPDVGIVGARLLNPGGALRHAGTVFTSDGLPLDPFGGQPADTPGPMGRLAVRSTVAAVSGACMTISRACWEAAGPFDAEGFGAAFDDADFCLRAHAAGFRTLYTPFAILVGPEPAPPSVSARLRAQALFIERHGAAGALDPASSPWRDLTSGAPVRRALDALPPAR